MVVSAAAQAVQVDHSLDLADLLEGPVGKIPRPGHPAFARTETHEDDRAAQESLVLGGHPSQFQEDRNAGGIGVCAGVQLRHRFPVHHQGMGTQMVVVRADHDVFLPQARIGALHDAHDVLRENVARRVRDLEILPQRIREHQHAGVAQGPVEIACRLPLAGGAGTASLHFLGAQLRDVAPQGRGNSKILCGTACRPEFKHQEYE